MHILHSERLILRERTSNLPISPFTMCIRIILSTYRESFSLYVTAMDDLCTKILKKGLTG